MCYGKCLKCVSCVFQTRTFIGVCVAHNVFDPNPILCIFSTCIIQSNGDISIMRHRMSLWVHLCEKENIIQYDNIFVFHALVEIFASSKLEAFEILKS